MNTELKAKWVAALRSGKYRQGRKLLKHAGRYCCLGVLCEVAGEPISPRESFPSASLLARAQVFCGGTLADMNDCGGKSFPEIADWIEANL